MSNTNRIDVHHHFLPPEFIAELDRQGRDWTGGPIIPEWNVSMARDVMERHGIAAAVGSVVPYMYWGDAAAAARWARHCNEFMAGIVRNDPQHFGAFAALPVPDTQGACREVEYALDVLKLDGVQLWSSSGGVYPGDPSLEELFQELNERAAIVHIHPHTMPPGSDIPKVSIPHGTLEFLFDTTRCITNLLYSGTLERYPSIRYIVAHAGGTVPYVAWRVAASTQLEVMQGRFSGGLQGALQQLQRLYYDTALSSSDYALAALRQFVPTSQILFGSDYPLVDESVVNLEVTGLEKSRVLDDSTRAAIDRGSALELFPRFARAGEGNAARRAG
jgi:predicted TIM-barrel fold metal-dependent hydrolase